MTISTQSSGIQARAANSSSTIAQSMQMLNHALPIKLDKDNYMWRTQMENVIYVNDFEDHVEGLTLCPSKTISNVETNPKFILW